MKKLTRRERFLVITAGALLILYGLSTFLFLPGFSRLQDSVNQRDSLRLSQSAMERAVTMLPQTEQSYHDLSKNVSDLAAQFYSAPDNTNVDMLITGICLSHGLKPRSLTIAQERVPVPLPGVVGADGELIPPEVLVDEETGEPLPNPYNAVNTVLVTVDLSGSFENVKAVAYDILETSYARIRALSFDHKENSANIVIEVFLQDDYGL